jgi:Sec-independent protein translocase protein TatA
MGTLISDELGAAIKEFQDAAMKLRAQQKKDRQREEEHEKLREESRKYGSENFLRVREAERRLFEVLQKETVVTELESGNK